MCINSALFIGIFLFNTFVKLVPDDGFHKSRNISLERQYKYCRSNDRDRWSIFVHLIVFS